ncbi:TPA: D-allose transporter substrate-binding protein [Pasteurella multocida]|uniref:D-allose transporter substrate-binding protein n=1 Tax=Pasteurella multocida TaxID=747 RepID=UPI000282828C|nr:D-allose transporter substrate-binding protein [Pasteurella multocida]ARB73158.2 allose ABC transporter [Pasteurella multocida]EJZ78625.1 D-allose ABC transporter, substrate-binding component [Pasteurella multocida subsp. gallicida X73]MCL7758298.1 D-allose transporter substrate-binding protein [Pasteurella multocida]MCL7791129.1 D-allose transporter substrate-binding protein [Pasteurella multocida]MCL7821278.1 D-allose transporter substrate-binding protein [Pasteurella multocida]
MKSLKIFKSCLAVMGLACSISAYSADYAVILKTLSNPFWVEMKSGVEKEAKTLNVSVDIFASPSEGDYQSQLQLFEDLMNKGYKGIAFAPLSPANLVMPAAKAYKKGIYLVNLDEKVDLDNLRKAGGNVEAFITTDNVAVGSKAAQFIVEQLGKNGGDVAIIEGKAGNASGEARKRGATEIFEKNTQIKLVASQPADWDRIKALDVATNVLSRNPNIKAFYAANDTMAMGVAQAVANAGKQGKVLVVGTDGVPEARKMVSEGKLTATVAQDPAEIGAKGLRLLVEAQKLGKQNSVDNDPILATVDSILVIKE